jgi:hypothetical protein
MAYSRAARDRGDRLGAQASASLGLLAILTALVGALILLLVRLLPAAPLLPMLGLVSLVAAGAVALLAWCSEAERHSDAITPWDVAGVLAFIGFGAGMLSRPEDVLQLFGLATAQ